MPASRIANEQTSAKIGRSRKKRIINDLGSAYLFFVRPGQLGIVPLKKRSRLFNVTPASTMGPAPPLKTDVAKGHSNEEVGQLLHISVRTVEKHVLSALRKLDLRSRVQLGRLLARPPNRSCCPGPPTGAVDARAGSRYTCRRLP